MYRLLYREMLLLRRHKYFRKIKINLKIIWKKEEKQKRISLF